jgi:hypothetical protein
MPAEGGDRLRALAAELEERDDAVAGKIAAVVEVAARAGAVRARAVELRAGLEAIPGELDAVERSEADARQAERDARVALVDAERRLEQVEASRRSSDEDRARARSEAKVAREALADAEHRVERLVARRAELREVEQALRAEAEGLVVQAREVASALRDAPRVAEAGKGEPGTSLEEIDDWGARARAALFVARGTLETERERIVAEASALGAAVLGEELGGMSVALVRRRVEDALS